MSPRTKRTLLVAIAALGVAAGGAATYVRLHPRHTDPTALTRFGADGAAGFKRDFNDASDRTRVLLMLSPT